MNTRVQPEVVAHSRGLVDGGSELLQRGSINWSCSEEILDVDGSSFLPHVMPRLHPQSLQPRRKTRSEESRKRKKKVRKEVKRKTKS